MRLTELLGAEVLDQAGESAGRVHDVRLVQDGPLIGGFGASLRLDGLIAGRRAVGARLGYGRRRMKGPLPVRLLFGWLHHDGHYVEWARIERIEPGQILISGSVRDLPSPGPSS
jgi:hypothetical protein